MFLSCLSGTALMLFHFIAGMLLREMWSINELLLAVARVYTMFWISRTWSPLERKGRNKFKMWLFRNNPYLIMHAFRLQSMYYKKILFKSLLLRQPCLLCDLNVAKIKPVWVYFYFICNCCSVSLTQSHGLLYFLIIVDIKILCGVCESYYKKPH